MGRPSRFSPEVRERAVRMVVAPSLWRYEVASVLARKAPARAAGLVRGLLDLELPTVDPDDQLVGEAVAMAVRLHGVTVYDASYHALALHLGGTFLTADEVYFRRARRLGAIELLAA